MSAPIILIIEDAPGLNDHGQPVVRQLEYSCRVRNTKAGPKLLIVAVRNAITKEPITNKEELPHPSIITEAAKLYDWHYHNREVFTEGRCIRQVPITTPE